MSSQTNYQQRHARLGLCIFCPRCGSTEFEDLDDEEGRA